MYADIQQRFQAELDGIREAGLWKGERVVEGPPAARVAVGGREVLNFCAKNYLGLANEPALIRAVQEGLDRWGFGLASVRFICGTQAIHKELEAAIAGFLGVEDAVLYTSCFDANGGLFETLLDESDVVISDALNHASIIDGIRLCRAQRQRYEHRDMADLERLLEAAAAAQTRLIVTEACSPWTATSRPWPRSATWPIGTTRSRWSMTATRQGSSARQAAAPGALWRRRPRGHHHLDARQGPRRSERRLHREPCRADSAPGPISSRTACPRPWSVPASPV